MDPQLADIKKQLDLVSDHARKLFASLNEEQLKKRPASGGWSVTECVQHLSQTSKQYESIFDSVFPTAPKGKGPFQMDFKGMLLCWVMKPPYRVMKVKTTPNLEPSPAGSASQVLSDFLASQERFAGYVDRADGIALDKTIITSPFNAKMQYNLFSCFQIITVHQRRHLWQAEQVKKKL